MGKPSGRVQTRGPLARERFVRFWTALVGKANAKTPLFENAVPSKRTAHWLADRPSGPMFSFVAVNDDEGSNVELYINWRDRERNLRVFRELEGKKGLLSGDSFNYEA